ncbi:MAG: indolepyruvate ferredoxin oxidoreductase subunit alpha [Synergistaceae bacterium]|jgi:indolepyruvate ferredoxin oxidoreductase alpha subunit|nr:indolepyruvate ferredoxin oxidoreductase subunit alpha [Synergistaceae bacterium]
MQKQILTGNEAVARGAYEAGCSLAAAYPGTPSTEILENMVQYKDKIYSQWACNEKVAAEIAAGASIGGLRTLCAMKHVGMNVAADPIFTMGYAGVNGGMVIVTADDPGCHSSQNEQDNRHYAPHSKIMMLEPSDSQECRDFTIAAFELSERFDTPVLLRVTTRVCHSKSIVELGERREIGAKKYERKTDKYAMLPTTARARHKAREELLKKVLEYSNDCPFNRAEIIPGTTVGVVTSGISFQYSREVFGDSASYLKLGLTYPLPDKLMADFARRFDTLYVVEENDPYLEHELQRIGFSPVGKEKIPILGELNTQIVREALLGQKNEELHSSTALPGRPPVMCPGCPHRGFFYTLSKNSAKIVGVGDIGCYGLGVSPPLNGFDFSICMGAGLSATIGFSKALAAQGDKRKVLGMVGDSTFFHSGLTSLIDVVTSGANVIACVLDNSITAMTGHQENPGTSKNLMGDPTPSVDILPVIRSLGVGEDRIRVVDPLDLAAVQSAMDAALAVTGPFVIVTRRPCVLIRSVAQANAGKYCKIDPSKCVGCKMCTKIACPAMAFSEGKSMIADPASCTGCGLCAQLCKFDAIERVGA